MDFTGWLTLNEGPAFTTFKGWYDYNRGNWADVERLAAKSPQLKDFIDRADREVQYGKFDRFGDPIQKFVSKYIKGHSKYELDPAKRQADLERRAGFNKMAGPSSAFGGGKVPSGATKAAPVHGSMDATADWTPSGNNQRVPRPHVQQTDPSMTKIQDHETRIAALEKLFQQFQTGQYQRQRA